jgi:hypothetical protein
MLKKSPEEMRGYTEMARSLGTPISVLRMCLRPEGSHISIYQKAGVGKEGDYKYDDFCLKQAV